MSAIFPVVIDLPDGRCIEDAWQPNAAELAAAWDLYVTLSTSPPQLGVLPPLRARLEVLHGLFDAVRQLLAVHGAGIAPRLPEGRISLGALAVSVLNDVVRPCTTQWHPQLAAYEQLRDSGTDPVVHESRWPLAAQAERSLALTEGTVAKFAELLADATGANFALTPA